MVVPLNTTVDVPAVNVPVFAQFPSSVNVFEPGERVEPVLVVSVLFTVIPEVRVNVPEPPSWNKL